MPSALRSVLPASDVEAADKAKTLGRKKAPARRSASKKTRRPASRARKTTVKKAGPVHVTVSATISAGSHDISSGSLQTSDSSTGRHDSRGRGKSRSTSRSRSRSSSESRSRSRSRSQSKDEKSVTRRRRRSASAGKKKKTTALKPRGQAARKTVGAASPRSLKQKAAGAEAKEPSEAETASLEAQAMPVKKPRAASRKSRAAKAAPKAEPGAAAMPSAEGAKEAKASKRAARKGAKKGKRGKTTVAEAKKAATAEGKHKEEKSKVGGTTAPSPFPLPSEGKLLKDTSALGALRATKEEPVKDAEKAPPKVGCE